MARAVSSFPVPVSPVMSTVVLKGTMAIKLSIRASIGGEVATTIGAGAIVLFAETLLRANTRSEATRIALKRLSSATGLVRQYVAPRFIASTAISIVP